MFSPPHPSVTNNAATLTSLRASDRTAAALRSAHLPSLRRVYLATPVPYTLLTPLLLRHANHLQDVTVYHQRVRESSDMLCDALGRHRFPALTRLDANIHDHAFQRRLPDIVRNLSALTSLHLHGLTDPVDATLRATAHLLCNVSFDSSVACVPPALSACTRLTELHFEQYEPTDAEWALVPASLLVYHEASTPPAPQLAHLQSLTLPRPRTPSATDQRRATLRLALRLC